MAGLSTTSGSRVVRFGIYEADLALLELFKGGVRIRLQEQPFRVLCLLLKEAGALVTREEIQKQLWPDNTFVDFDKGLNSAVAKLRQALVDSAENPRFIETVPRKGYRFICPVTVIEARVEAAATPAVVPELPVRRSMSKEAGQRRRGALALMAVAGLLSLLSFGYLLRRTPAFDVMQGPLTMTRVTGTGDLVKADISGDGKYAAYVRETAEGQSLWVRQLSAEHELRIASLGRDECEGVAFSADGESIYFVRTSALDPDGALYRIPVLGGDAQLVLKGISGAPALSPDGQSVAYVRSTRITHGEDTLMMASLAGGGAQPLITYPAPGIFHKRVVWSSDGARLIFVALAKLTSIRAGGGRPEIAPERAWRDINDLATSPNPGEVLMTGSLAGLASPYKIYRVSLTSKGMQALTHDEERYEQVRMSKDGQIVLALQQIGSRTLEVMRRGDDSGGLVVGRGGLNIGGQSGARWTPDGKIVYGSPSYGNEREDLWEMDADGSNKHPITQLRDQSYAYSPAVADSGEFVFFDVWSPEDHANVWRLDLTDGTRKKLTEGVQDFPLSVSHDGKWVVYKSLHGDKPVLMRVRSEGGPVQQLTEYACDLPAISPDDRSIACITVSQGGGRPQLNILPIEGGSPSVSFPLPNTLNVDMQPAWTDGGRAISFANRIGGVGNIWEQRLGGGAATALTHFTANDIYSFDWRKDGALVVLRGQDATDAILMRSAKRGF
jgi:Tol biopolymer transport system component/DNA-binding winged helix-turn-helix (wHTH) protein